MSGQLGGWFTFAQPHICKRATPSQPPRLTTAGLKALSLDPVQPLAAQFPQAAVEMKFAVSGALDHGREIAARAAREMLARLRRDDRERDGRDRPAERDAGLAPQALATRQVRPQALRRPRSRCRANRGTAAARDPPDAGPIAAVRAAAPWPAALKRREPLFPASRSFALGCASRRLGKLPPPRLRFFAGHYCIRRIEELGL